MSNTIDTADWYILSTNGEHATISGPFYKGFALHQFKQGDKLISGRELEELYEAAKFLLFEVEEP